MTNQKLNNLLKDPRTNWRYVVIVVILAILVGGGILGYYYWWIADLETRLAELELKLPEKKVKDETAGLSSKALATEDWKTYRNEEYGFELKYPEEYVIKGKKEDRFGYKEYSLFYIMIAEPKIKEIPEAEGILFGTPFQILITPKVTPKELEYLFGLTQPIESTDEYFSSEKVKEHSNIYVGEITSGRRTGFQLVHTEMAEEVVTLFNNNDGTWFIIESVSSRQSYYKAERREAYDSIYDSIVTSLKFIEPEKASTKEEDCVNSGGAVEISLCCESVSDFPNLCLIGACGCSPENSHQIKTCDCGPEKCFNGNECVAP